MQVTRYYEQEKEEKKEKLRIEGFTSRGPKAEERLQKRMEAREKQLA